MGITTAILKVKEHRKANKFAEVEFMVDSGAVYSIVPGEILKEIECIPYREIEFVLGDGTIIKRKVGDAFFEYENNKGAAPVIFGEEDDYTLLGSTTLTALGLVLHPFTRSFQKMRMLLANFKKSRMIIK